MAMLNIYPEGRNPFFVYPSDLKQFFTKNCIDPGYEKGRYFPLPVSEFQNGMGEYE